MFSVYIEGDVFSSLKSTDKTFQVYLEGTSGGKICLQFTGHFKRMKKAHSNGHFLPVILDGYTSVIGGKY
jgi:hypothetical protein